MRPNTAFRALISSAAAALLLAGSAIGQTITSGGIVNAASFVNGQAVAPGSLVAIFGSQLANSTATADTVPWSVNRANVTVTFNGIMAPIEFVSAGQINVQVPWAATPTGAGTANVVVNNNGTVSAPATVTLNPITPGVFQSSGHAIAVNVTDPASARYGTICAPSGSIPGLTTFPARVNDTIFFYANGLGPVDSAIQDGFGSTDKTRKVVTTPMVLVGSTPVTPLFAGLSSFPGVNQVNIAVPQVPAGNAVPLQVLAGGITSPNTTTIAIQ